MFHQFFPDWPLWLKIWLWALDFLWLGAGFAALNGILFAIYDKHQPMPDGFIADIVVCAVLVFAILLCWPLLVAVWIYLQVRELAACRRPINLCLKTSWGVAAILLGLAMTTFFGWGNILPKECYQNKFTPKIKFTLTETECFKPT